MNAEDSPPSGPSHEALTLPEPTTEQPEMPATVAKPPRTRKPKKAADDGKEKKLMTKLGQADPPYDKWGGGPFSERRFGFGAVLPTDAPVSPGDCGGPVVDTSGKVAGVTVSRALRVATYVLTPADVKKAVAKIKAGG